MEVKLQHHSFLNSSSSNPWLSQNSIVPSIFSQKVAHLDYLLSNWGNSRKRCLVKLALRGNGNQSLNYQLVGYKKLNLAYRKTRKMDCPYPLVSADDGVTVNGSPSASTSSDVEEMGLKFNHSLLGDDSTDKLVQSLHDAARVFEVAIKEQDSLSKFSWLSTAWLGVDRNAWVKTLCYEASVYSLLQAAHEISFQGDGRDRDVNIFVQRSLLRQSAPLESLIRDKLSAKQPEAYEWFWSKQVPMVAASFFNYLEEDLSITSGTAVFANGLSSISSNGSDISLLLLALTCNAAITKLGTTKVSCPRLFSMSADISRRLMDMLVDFIPVCQAYHSIKHIGQHREFLVHFGPRVAACRVKNDRGSEEVIFWVNLVQKQLQQAINRERIWSRLTTSESIEILEKDLAIFGFFIALGRSTQSFLSDHGFDVQYNPIESFIGYLIGGSVLYYPQLSSISSYQLYVEVVCEELDWLPFYPGNDGTTKLSHGHKNKQKGPPNAEAIPQVLDACSHWMQSFIKYSTWLQNPSNVKAARFLSRGHTKLMECMEELGMSWKMTESNISYSVEITRPEINFMTDKETDSFNKALESVEGALVRLEKLLQGLPASSSNSGKENIKAACSDLEKIRKLKKEAEFLEASFRAKAALLQQGEDESSLQSSISEQQQYLKGNGKKSADVSKFQGLWNFPVYPPTMKPGPDVTVVNASGDADIGQTTTSMSIGVSESNDIRRFEVLRNELMELEKRVQKSTDQYENEEDIKVTDDDANYHDEAASSQLIHVPRNENIIRKSIAKLKKTSKDVLQGTQLLAIDVAASMGLLKRLLIGDELTEKERKTLRRTMMDLASVVPIGVLMLLPVTAVGHAAMLAAIQRYVPALIPSTYGPERLDLLRQLEKVKEMETSEPDANENGEALS
ncbi:LETM1 and EF-hand domain-containing protein [Salix suchowensis]|nr:LETM1 and EF-hand domain-containing protein [Salix suchowensis]